MGSPWPFYNVATAVSDGFAAAGGSAADLTAAFAGAAGYRVWLRDGMDDAEAVLQRAGFAAIDELPAFWMPLSEVTEWAAPDGYEVVRASTDDEVVECLLGDRWAGYMDDAEVARTFPDPAAMARVGDRSFYLGRREGQLVATGQTISIGGVVGTYGMWTAEPHRRRGLGNAILARGLLDARAEGKEIASIQASEMGAGIYQRAGFRKFCNYRIFRPPL
ncbi:MAG: GNAT family N-acetyltransferase [Candidatus Dormiibacterota bacterium]